MCLSMTQVGIEPIPSASEQYDVTPIATGVSKPTVKSVDHFCRIRGKSIHIS